MIRGGGGGTLTKEMKESGIQLGVGREAVTKEVKERVGHSRGGWGGGALTKEVRERIGYSWGSGKGGCWGDGGGAYEGSVGGSGLQVRVRGTGGGEQEENWGIKAGRSPIV